MSSAWRRVAIAWVLVAAVLSVGACQTDPPNRQSVVDRLTDQLREMPGVADARDVLCDSLAQGQVFFRVTVDVVDGISADQLAAIATEYLGALAAIDHRGYQAEFDARRGWNVFTIDSGELPITNTAQIIAQARDWASLRQRLAEATVSMRATIAHPHGQTPIQEWGHSNIASIQLADLAGYSQVSAAVTMLAHDFAHLGVLDWTISGGKDHPADIKTSRRFPTPGELQLWDRLNADQRIVHTDKLRINRPGTTAVWVAEKTTASHDPSVAAELAREHLPLIATLPAPVLYTASDHLSGHLGTHGQATGPLAVTVGGCTTRDYTYYRPDRVETTLMAQYERC